MGRKGKERKGKERKGKEGKGKRRKGNNQSVIQFLPCHPFWGRRARNFMAGLTRKERKGINQSINQSIIQFLPRLPFWGRRARNFMTGLTRKEREGKEGKGKERKGKEKKGKGRKGNNQSVIQFLPFHPFWGRRARNIMAGLTRKERKGKESVNQ